MGLEYYGFAIFIACLVCIVAIVFKTLFSNVRAQSKMLDEREAQLLQTYNAVETIMEEFQDQAKATTDELKHREDEYRALVHSMDVFHLPPGLEAKQQVMERLPRSLATDTTRIKAAGEVIEHAERLINREPAAPQTAQAVPPAPVQKPPAPAAAPAPASATAPKPVAPAAPSPPPAPEPPATPDAVFKKFFDDAADSPPPTPYAPSPVSGGSRKDEILTLFSEGKTDVEIASSLGITRNEVQLVVGLTQ